MTIIAVILGLCNDKTYIFYKNTPQRNNQKKFVGINYIYTVIKI
jgi:hypothetical protein